MTTRLDRKTTRTYIYIILTFWICSFSTEGCWRKGFTHWLTTATPFSDLKIKYRRAPSQKLGELQAKVTVRDSDIEGIIATALVNKVTSQQQP